MAKRPQISEELAQFGERLRIVRERRGFELVELAKRADVARFSLQGWENGTTEPLIGGIVRVMDILEIDLKVLLGRAPLPPLSPEVAARLGLPVEPSAEVPDE